MAALVKHLKAPTSTKEKQNSLQTGITNLQLGCRSCTKILKFHFSVWLGHKCCLLWRSNSEWFLNNNFLYNNQYQGWHLFPTHFVSCYFFFSTFDDVDSSVNGRTVLGKSVVFWMNFITFGLTTWISFPSRKQLTASINPFWIFS